MKMGRQSRRSQRQKEKKARDGVTAESESTGSAAPLADKMEVPPPAPVDTQPPSQVRAGKRSSSRAIHKEGSEEMKKTEETPTGRSGRQKSQKVVAGKRDGGGRKSGRARGKNEKVVAGDEGEIQSEKVVGDKRKRRWRAVGQTGKKEEEKAAGEEEQVMEEREKAVGAKEKEKEKGKEKPVEESETGKGKRARKRSARQNADQEETYPEPRSRRKRRKTVERETEKEREREKNPAKDMMTEAQVGVLAELEKIRSKLLSNPSFEEKAHVLRSCSSIELLGFLQDGISDVSSASQGKGLKSKGAKLIGSPRPRFPRDALDPNACPWWPSVEEMGKGSGAFRRWSKPSSVSFGRTLGESPLGADFRWEDKRISRIHASVIFDDLRRKYQVVNYSRNGILLNGDWILAHAVDVKDKDILQIGRKQWRLHLPPRE
eukprot:TRINITY_DN24550_c0_g4_i3.p2 TRINITY_DN24550_c0_g4~~TRINITY_DN24550_c0_g4_i3.p2  ORF type:complete len:432 (-),score=147.98 TRINITY_DN24550_c0_g4_i3:1679-2974(-)